MVDVDTFLTTTLYVMVDDFCQSHPTTKKPGPETSLSESEVITLVISLPVGADSLASVTSTATPRVTCGMCLPDPAQPPQFNRLVRSNGDLIE